MSGWPICKGWLLLLCRLVVIAGVSAFAAVCALPAAAAPAPKLLALGVGGRHICADFAGAPPLNGCSMLPARGRLSAAVAGLEQRVDELALDERWCVRAIGGSGQKPTLVN